jgi:hypothetical protein
MISAQIIRTREEKTVNTEFHKAVMDRLLKPIQLVRPPAFCSRDFFLSHNNARAQIAASVYQFLTQKNATNLYDPSPLNLQISLRQSIFCSTS